MQYQPYLIRQIRDDLRMELRRKKLEDEFTQLRRKMLKLSLYQNNNEMETEPLKYQLVKQVPPIEFFIFLIQQLNLDEETISQLREVIDNIQYQLDNGMEFDLLEWVGSVDIVKVLIESMKQFKQNPGYLALEISNCLRSLTSVQKKYIAKSLRAQAYKAIEVYKEWFERKHPEIKNEALKGIYMLTEKNQEVPKNIITNEVIDNILQQLQSNSIPLQQKYFLWEMISQNVKNIKNEQQIILILKIAQRLIEAQQERKLYVGLNILYEVCQNEYNISFVISIGCWQKILKQIETQNERIKLQILQIIDKISKCDEEEITEFFIKYNILQIIQSQQNSQETQVRYQSTQILQTIVSRGLYKQVKNSFIYFTKQYNDFIDMELDFDSTENDADVNYI